MRPHCRRFRIPHRSAALHDLRRRCKQRQQWVDGLEFQPGPMTFGMPIVAGATSFLRQHAPRRRTRRSCSVGPLARPCGALIHRHNRCHRRLEARKPGAKSELPRMSRAFERFRSRSAPHRDLPTSAPGPGTPRDLFAHGCADQVARSRRTNRFATPLPIRLSVGWFRHIPATVKSALIG
jgi:hypothetical protein